MSSRRCASVQTAGGIGSFGKAFTKRLLEDGLTDRTILYYRDELKQYEVRQSLGDGPRLRWPIGDVRDRERLSRTMSGVDHVVHAAALKQVDTAQFNRTTCRRRRGSPGRGSYSTRSSPASGSGGARRPGGVRHHARPRHVGKGLANGYPLSAVAGRADVTAFMTKIVSGKFGGDPVSLAADAVRGPVATTDVRLQLRATGIQLLKFVSQVIQGNSAADFLSIAGRPTRQVLSWKDSAQHRMGNAHAASLGEMMRKVILILSTGNQMSTHSDRDRTKVDDFYRVVMPLLVNADRAGSVRDRLECPSLEPLSRVR